MKKLILLSVSFFLTIVVSAQMINTTIPITGLGEFALGMTPEEMIEVLEQSKSSNSKISGIFDGESSLSITNLKCFGYLFDECYFTFSDNKLNRINFSMDFDKKNKEPKEFEELLSILEDDYGKLPYQKQGLPSIWENDDKTKIMFFLKNEKKKTRITIAVMRDIFNLNNTMIYK
ncbi:hypothetical protein GGR21_003876 [Dysgonomonas hofstadii]|uniref:Uncharacterized protein n=1 Tax=Dysgonomonas hofstadii TaxID=637886 RepID=A0A840CZX5_9BACT|nr:hypothetical protein [Dysgonomonas hofstadii]MBB4037952.1 hypothetical protein [Dysgonomonas hofstadii]